MYNNHSEHMRFQFAGNGQLMKHAIPQPKCEYTIKIVN